MKVTLGDVTTELPDGWADGSVIRYSDPTRPAAEGSAQPSLVINRADNDGQDLSALLEGQSEQLASSLIGFEVKASGKEGDAHFSEHSFGASGEFTQIILLRAIDRTVFIVTGTANTSEFSKLRTAFVRAARSLAGNRKTDPMGR